MLKQYIPQPGRREYFTIGLLAAEIVVFSLVAANFLSIENLSSVLRNATILSVISIGMTMVILMGGIDVSVGPAMGVAAIAAAHLLQGSLNPVIVVTGGVLAGTALGLFNGILVAWVRIPAIIVTLGTMSLFEAGVFGLLGGEWITGLPPVFAGLVGGTLFGIPAPAFLVVGCYLLFWYLLTFRPYGRHIYAVGNNIEAAKLAGINVRRVQIVTFGLMGALVGAAAILYLGLMGGVEITVGSNLAIESIAAVVIGGAAITGGRGSVIGTLAGVLFMAIMDNGIVLLGIPSLWENAIIGILVLISVSIDRLVEYGIQRREGARRWAGRRAGGMPVASPEGTVPSQAGR